MLRKAVESPPHLSWEFLEFSVGGAMTGSRFLSERTIDAL